MQYNTNTNIIIVAFKSTKKPEIFKQDDRACRRVCTSIFNLLANAVIQKFDIPAVQNPLLNFN